MDKLPPLTTLTALDAFYRAGSVTGAAKLLGRTHSAVSKQLHQLQDHAGVELFRKSGLHLELSRAGQKFAQDVTRNMADLRQAYTRLTAENDEKTVKLAVSSTFAKQWAIPTIARFNNDHPDVEVMIRIVGPQGSRSLEDSVDIVLSWDRLLSPAVEHPMAASLGDVHIGIVLSPNYQHKTTEKQLQVQTLIHRRGNEAAWGNWSDLTGIQVSHERAIKFDFLSLVFEAAESQMGAAIAPKIPYRAGAEIRQPYRTRRLLHIQGWSSNPPIQRKTKAGQTRENLFRLACGKCPSDQRRIHNLHIHHAAGLKPDLVDERFSSQPIRN